VFQDVHSGGPAAAAGIAPGDVLIRIGDREVVPPEKPSFAMGQTHELEVAKLSGPAKLSISVPDAKHKENPCAVPDAVKAYASDGVPVIKIPLFPGKLGIDFARELSSVFECRVNGADRIVLDLRGNPGGGVGIGRRILEDIPHAVLHITDVKSLWIRLGIIDDRGLASSRKIKYKFFPSKGAPHDFGYLVLRPDVGSIPLVVVPCLSKFIVRAVSVFESLPSPHRIQVEFSEWPDEAFAFGCEKALTSAFDSFEPNLNLSN
jgi:PDZ domain